MLLCRITDTGSLHILGKEDDEVLFTVKDEVNVHGTEHREHRERDKNKPKKYFHITGEAAKNAAIDCTEACKLLVVDVAWNGMC